MESCPSPEQLQHLLLEEVVPDRALLEAHVEQCARCQQTLDQLTNDSLERRARESPAARATPLLNLYNQQADHSGPSTRETNATTGFPAPAPEDPPGLDFLAAPTRPDALGRLGHYEVLEVLGKGGFGIVLRAFDESLHRVVAIKALAAALAATSPARKRFLREARAAAQVRHENVVQIHAVGEQPLPYLVMEYVPGETLQQRLDRTGPFEAAEVVAIGRQIAEGLAAAHAAGLIHRDVKPANVLLEAGPRLRVKLTDFGLARAADDATLTQSGVVLGTPLYMSPEQAAGKKLDHRSDLFSLGSVLYAITSGRPPFRAENTLAILKRVAEDTPRPIPEIIPETPAWLCQVIARLMAKDPGERFQSAAEAGAALEAGPAALHRPALGRCLIPLAAAALLAAGAIGIGLRASGFLDSANDADPMRAGDTPKTPQGKAPPGQGNPKEADIGRKPAALAVDHRPSVGGFQLPGLGFVRHPASGEDGKLLAVPWTDRVCLFETPSGRHLRTLSGPAGEVAIHWGSRLLAAAGRPRGATSYQLRVWNLDTYTELCTLEAAGQGTHLRHLALSPAGTLVAFSGDSGLQVWEPRTGKLVKTLPGKAGRICFNPQGTLLALCETSGGIDPEAVFVWDTKSWDKVGSPAPPIGNCPDMHFSPDGTLLAVATSREVFLWDRETFKRAWGFDLDCYWWFAFTPDGKTILAAATDDARATHTVKRWDIHTGAKLGSFDIRFRSPVHFAPALSADGRALYVPYKDSDQVRVIDTASGAELLPAPEVKGEK